MRSYFKLIPCVFVDESRAVHRELFNFRGEGNGPRDNGAAVDGGLKYEFCRIVNHFVIERFKLDSDFLLEERHSF